LNFVRQAGAPESCANKDPRGAALAICEKRAILHGDRFGKGRIPAAPFIAGMVAGGESVDSTRFDVEASFRALKVKKVGSTRRSEDLEGEGWRVDG